MMKRLLVWFLLMIPLSVAASGNDSLLISRNPFAAWKPSAALHAQLSQTGYSTAAIAMFRWKRLAVTAGGKMVISKTHRFSTAPYGVVTGAYFFPNGNVHRFNGFINADYQLTFQGNNRSSAVEIPGHKVHEYTAGYGFTYSVSKRLEVMSAINFGRYTETMRNAYTGEKVRFSGYNSLLRLGVNYTFGP